MSLCAPYVRFCPSLSYFALVCHGLSVLGGFGGVSYERFKNRPDFSFSTPLCYWGVGGGQLRPLSKSAGFFLAHVYVGVYAVPMTKKHFEAIAATIRKEREFQVSQGNHSAAIAITAVAHGLASDFAQANPRFDRVKFLDACRPA